MAGDEPGSSSGGIGFFSALGIMFIGLKIAGIVDWPWWVVLSPIWGSEAAALLLLVVLALLRLLER